MDIQITPIELVSPPDTSKFYQPRNFSQNQTITHKVEENNKQPTTKRRWKTGVFNQSLPKPPSNYKHKVAELHKRLLQLPHCSYHEKFIPEHSHAKKFAKDYKSILGTLRFERGFDVADWQDQIKMTTKSATPKLYTLFGAPGSTKSSSLVRLITELGLEQLACGVTVICPRVDQHKDWMEKLKPKYDYSVKTFETPFRQPVANVVVVEELGQTPSAWLDALLFWRHNITHLIVLGDFKQNVHYESNPNSISRDVIPTIDRLMVSNPNTKYLNDSYRLANNVCDKLNINCKVDRPDTTVRTTLSIGPDLPILASSDSRAAKLAKQGYAQVFTYPGAQGADFKNEEGKHIPYVLQVNKDCLSMSERCWFTAITRSNVEIILWIEDPRIIEELWLQSDSKPSLRALLELLQETTNGSRVDLTQARGANYLEPICKLRSREEVNDACYQLSYMCKSNAELARSCKNFRNGFSKRFKFEQPTDREISHLLTLLRIDAVVGSHATPRPYHTSRFLWTSEGYKFLPLE